MGLIAAKTTRTPTGRALFAVFFLRLALSELASLERLADQRLGQNETRFRNIAQRNLNIGFLIRTRRLADGTVLPPRRTRPAKGAYGEDYELPT